MRVEMATGVSTVEARGGRGNAMLGEEEEPGPSPSQGGQREKTGQNPARRLPGCLSQWRE